MISVLLRTLAFSLCVTTACVAEPLRLNTEENPPFNFTNDHGEIVGVATEILRAVADKAGVAITIEMAPWQRAYGEALNKLDACVFSTAMTEQRRPLFHWIGPLAQNDWTIFGRTDDPSPPASIADLKGKRIAVYQGDAKEAFFQNLTGYILDAAPRDELNALKLSNSRVDYWVAGKLTGAFIARKAAVSNLRPHFSFRTVDLYLACNKVVPESTINALSAALALLRQDGTLDKIEGRYVLGS